jgi:hypothetical protein
VVDPQNSVEECNDGNNRAGPSAEHRCGGDVR